MIEIGDAAIVEREVGQVSVVGVLLNENDFTGTDRFENAIGDCRLARSCAATNADYHAHHSSSRKVPAKAQRRKGKKDQRPKILRCVFAPLRETKPGC